MWLYGSGFPKATDIGLMVDKRRGVESKVVGIGKSGGAETHTRTMHSQTKEGKDCFGGEFEIKEAQNEWRGWKSALKPSFEPIIMARKPVENTLIDNVLKYGTGALNIDECKIGSDTIKGGTMPDLRDVGQKSKESIGIDKLSFGQVGNAARLELEDHVGRYPANTILTYSDTDFEEVCGNLPNTKGGKRHNIAIRQSEKNSGYGFDINTRNEFDDSGSACRYYYCAKATTKDREEGCDFLEGGVLHRMRPDPSGIATGLNKSKKFAPIKRKNTHPTVKPTELMQYLIRLVTPKGGIVLDPFMGSGSTGKACAYENIERNANYKFIGIEKEEDYCKIASARIEYASQIEKEIEPQTSLF